MTRGVKKKPCSVKSIGGRPINPAPADWRPDLKGDDLELAWKYAAGFNPDGRPKNAAQHKCARSSINRALKCLRQTTLDKETGTNVSNE